MNVGNMAEALKARDNGIESAKNHAETDAPGWSDRAYKTIRLMASVTTTEWTMEQARAACYACGLDKPDEERAFGAVTQRLIRDGIIEPVGYARAASSNGAIKRTYRLVRAG